MQVGRGVRVGGHVWVGGHGCMGVGVYVCGCGCACRRAFVCGVRMSTDAPPHTLHTGTTQVQ